MQNIETKRIMTLSLKLFLIFIHAVAAIVAFLGLAVLLIGVYHTSVFLVAHAWSPIFLSVLPTVTLGLSLGVIFLKQPVHNLLCLISVFFSAALLYLYAGAEFLAFLFLIVYVGAIAILFLFVIMLLHLKPVFAAAVLVISGFAWFMYPSAGLVTLGLDDTLASGISSFFVESDTLALKNVVTASDSLTWFVNNKFSDILLFSDLLYTYHCFLFFVAGLLLLTAMLGAIILATSATDANPYGARLAVDPVSILFFLGVVGAVYIVDKHINDMNTQIATMEVLIKDIETKVEIAKVLNAASIEKIDTVKLAENVEGIQKDIVVATTTVEKATKKVGIVKDYMNPKWYRF